MPNKQHKDLQGSDLHTLTAVPAEGIWSDYSASSTIVGWASFTTKSIYTKKIGTTVFVKAILTGVSNSTSVTFTVPYTSAALPAVSFQFVSTGNADNSGTLTAPSYGYLPYNSAIVTITKNYAGDAWTAGNNKDVYCNFWYEAA